MDPKAFTGDVLSFTVVADVEPAWLSVAVVAQAAGEVVLRVSPTATALAAGSYDAALRLTTGPAGGGPAETIEVPIAHRVRAGLRSPPFDVCFRSIDRAQPPGRVIRVFSDVPGDLWSATVEYAAGGVTGWLVLPVEAGSFQDGVALLELRVVLASNGLHLATVVLRDRRGVARARVPVVYEVRRTYPILGVGSVPARWRGLLPSVPPQRPEHG